MTAATLPLKFQIGARTLAAVPRRLVRVPLSLGEALAGHVPMLPALAATDHGFLVTSLPEARLGALGSSGLVVAVRQRYRRYWVDLAGGEAAWLAGLSANTRSSLKRKRRKLAAEPGFAITRHRRPDEIAAFHAEARVVSAKTYQEALLGSGLPVDPAALISLAAADRVRAWLLSIRGMPIAYLACTADGDTLRYDHVGHDPAFGDLSPGSVLQAEALHDLFDEMRFARFDFTEGEGQHKRGLATGSVACVDVLLLRATPANRLTLAALAGFDGAVVVAKRLATHPLAKRIAKKVRR